MAEVEGVFGSELNGYLNVDRTRLTTQVEDGSLAHEFSGSLHLSHPLSSISVVTTAVDCRTPNFEEASMARALVERGLPEAQAEMSAAVYELNQGIITNAKRRVLGGVVAGITFGVGVYQAIFDKSDVPAVTGGLILGGFLAGYVALKETQETKNTRADTVKRLIGATRKQELFLLAAQTDAEFVPIESRRRVEATE
jgi:hypothetical protein